MLGYIPKAQHHFGDRYALFSRNAIAHMEADQIKYNEQQKRLRNIIQGQQTPLKPVIDKTKMYFPKGTKHSLSPYTYANDDPRKYMLSGYTGYVPGSRDIIGKIFLFKGHIEFFFFSAEGFKSQGILFMSIIKKLLMARKI